MKNQKIAFTFASVHLAALTTPAALITLALGVLAACSAHIDGGPVDLTPPVVEFKNQVEGPALDGTWTSDCIADVFDSAKFTKFTLTIAGQNLTRKSDRFSDAACDKSVKSVVEQGLFRYERVVGPGIWEVEYRFTIPNGWYQGFEQYRPDGDNVLWISDQSTSPYIKLSKDGTSTSVKPTPAPTPGPTPGPTPAPIGVGKHVPHYGDEVNFAGVASGHAQTETYTNQGQREDGNWTVFRDIEGGGQVDMGYSYYTSLWSSQKTADLFANCAAKGGISQVITVKAGTFQTCMIDDGTRRTWYADVPLWGKVKIERRDGTYASELTSYSWGDSHSLQ